MPKPKPNRNKPKIAAGCRRGAILDTSCTPPRYRYLLWRAWNDTKPRLLWVGGNPSTADAEQDDNTIRRLYWFSHREGFGSFAIVNLFALRSSSPKDVYAEAKRGGDPVGPQNDREIIAALRTASLVICAWGSPLKTKRSRELHAARVEVVEHLFRDYGINHGFDLRTFGLSDSGHPLHPLYQGDDQALIPYRYRYAQNERSFNEDFREPVFFENEVEVVSRLLYPTQEEATAVFAACPDLDDVSADEVRPGYAAYGPATFESLEISLGYPCWTICPEGTPKSFPVWIRDANGGSKC